MSKSIQSIAIYFTATCFLVASGCSKRGEDTGPIAIAQDVNAMRTVFTSEASSDGGTAKEAATGTGWGTLRGRFVLDGAAPTMGFLDVTSDKEVCAPGGKVPTDPSFKTGEGGGVQDICIYVLKAPRVHDEAKPTEADKIIFDQKNCVFLSQIAPVYVGIPVTVKNSDPVGHNTKVGGGNSNNDFNGIIGKLEELQYTPKVEEAIPLDVSCSIHPWMKSAMIPRADKYIAVTKPDGTFEISNIPAGVEVKLQVWHKHGAGTKGSLIVDTAEAKAFKWNKRGQISVKLEENETREMNIKIPVASFSL